MARCSPTRRSRTLLAYAIDRASKQGFAGGLTHRDAIAKAQVQAVSREGALPRLAPAPGVIAMATVEAGSRRRVLQSRNAPRPHDRHRERMVRRASGIRLVVAGPRRAVLVGPAGRSRAARGMGAGLLVARRLELVVANGGAEPVVERERPSGSHAPDSRRDGSAIAAEVAVAPTATLSVSPASITGGAAATLTSGSTSNATTVSINQGIGTVAASGTRNVFADGDDDLHPDGDQQCRGRPGYYTRRFGRHLQRQHDVAVSYRVSRSDRQPSGRRARQRRPGGKPRDQRHRRTHLESGKCEVYRQAAPSGVDQLVRHRQHDVADHDHGRQ